MKDPLQQDKDMHQWAHHKLNELVTELEEVWSPDLIMAALIHLQLKVAHAWGASLGIAQIPAGNFAKMRATLVDKTLLCFDEGFKKGSKANREDMPTS